MGISIPAAMALNYQSGTHQVIAICSIDLLKGMSKYDHPSSAKLGELVQIIFPLSLDEFKLSVCLFKVLHAYLLTFIVKRS